MMNDEWWGRFETNSMVRCQKLEIWPKPPGFQFPLTVKVEHLATSGVSWKCGIPQKSHEFHSSTIVSLIETTHWSNLRHIKTAKFHRPNSVQIDPTLRSVFPSFSEVSFMFAKATPGTCSWRSLTWAFNAKTSREEPSAWAWLVSDSKNWWNVCHLGTITMEYGQTCLNMP